MFLEWLSALDGHPKHTGVAHPVTTLVVALCGILAVSVVAHDVIFGAPSLGAATEEGGEAHRRTAALVLWYLLALSVIRVLNLGLARFCYEMLWSCNTSMVLAAFGLRTHRPHLVAAAAMSVAIDQLMWYVDLAGFIFAGKWPIGVAKYLAWPETTWARRFTSVHHLFFLPVCVYSVGFPGHAATHDSAPRTSMHYIRDVRDDYCLMVIYITATAIASRFMTPFHLRGCRPFAKAAPKGGREEGEGRRRLSLTRQISTALEQKGDVLSRLCGGAPQPANTADSSMHGQKKSRSDSVADTDAPDVVLNINLVYEVWKDVGKNFPILECSHPSAAVHVPRLIAIWAGLNAPCAVVLACLSSLMAS